MTLCDLVTVFAETKSVTKSRLQCICLRKNILIGQSFFLISFEKILVVSKLADEIPRTFGDNHIFLRIFNGVFVNPTKALFLPMTFMYIQTLVMVRVREQNPIYVKNRLGYS